MASGRTLRKLRKLVLHPSWYIRDWAAKRSGTAWFECGIPDTDLRVAIDAQSRIEESGPQPDFPVDAVFTHVGGNDPAWQATYWKARRKWPEGMPNGMDGARFRDFGEIRRSVRAARECLPWLRRIIVASGEAQAEDFPAGVEIVRPMDFIPEEFLPTFNSHVIEAHLDGIPGLAEHFVYFNDDVFALRRMQPSHFFSGSGRMKLFATRKSLRRMKEAGRSTPTLSASFNCIRLLGDGRIDMPPAHTYFPLRRSVFAMARERFGTSIQNFLPNRFRSENDLNVATFLVPWLAWQEGLAEMSFDACAYFDVSSPAADGFYRYLLARKGSGALPHSACTNMASDAGLTPERVERFRAFLDEMFDE